MMDSIVGPPPPRPESEAAIRSTAHHLVRRSAVYCQVMTVPGAHSVNTALLADELSIIAEHTEEDPDGTLVFLGELSNGYEWQVRVKLPPVLDLTKPV